MHNFIKKLKLSAFAVKVFTAVFCCAIIPFYIVLLWIKSGYEEYMKQEYCQTTVQMLSSGEESIHSVFDKMANLSNIIVFDKDLIQTFLYSNDYYENTKVVDATISQLIINNFINLDDLILTLFDNKGRIYTNWTTGYNDYSFLLEEPWVKKACIEKGHIFWNLFDSGYIKGDENEKYISLSRAIYSNGIDGDYLGCAIISVRQDTFSKILEQYLMDDKDCVYVCDSQGNSIFGIDPENTVKAEVLAAAVAQSEGVKKGGSVIDIGDERYLVSAYDISRPSVLNLDLLKVIHFTNYEQIESQISGISGKMNIYFLIGFLISVAASAVISKYVVRPINLLAKQMDSYSIDGEVTILDTKRSDEIGRLNRSYKEMALKIKKLFEDLNHEYEIKEQYRYESLRAKINPHFLFNTLNTIRWMAIIRKAENITETIDALAGMLSYSMSKEGEIVPLGDEINNIKNYVFIQNCRYGEKYKVKIDIKEDLLLLKVVRFILQPIVENAMAHAFKDFSGVGEIVISAWIQGDILKICVADNGNGMTEETLHLLNDRKSGKNREKFTGIGYANVDERIRVAYGNKYGLSVESSLGKGVKVIYTMPVIHGK